jgi:hypothetical protein
MKGIHSLLLSALLLLPIALFANKAPRKLTIVNNQPFRIQMPVRLRAQKLEPGDWETSKGRPVQQLGDDVVFISDLNPSATENLILHQRPAGRLTNSLTVQPVENGISLTYRGKDLGRLSWDLVVHDPLPANTRPDIAGQFSAIPLSFQRSSSGPVFDLWTAEGTKAGLKLTVQVVAYHAGFLDLDAKLENVSAKTTSVYAATVCRWQQPLVTSRLINYNNETAPLAGDAWSAFRGTDNSGTGDNRHMFIQRGIDWINSEFTTDLGVLWLNDFAQSFTVHQDATAKRPGRTISANSPQLGQEAQTANGSLYSITEIAKSNTKYYTDRFAPNLLPLPGEPLSFSSRLVFEDKPATSESSDEKFIAYTGYSEQHSDANGTQFTIGVAGVRFGTNYFPYSTLGENFTIQKLPGMDRAAYWPLAADTVTNWRLFADDIRRDLRIAKSMGFATIRLHHLELISSLDKKLQTEYLDFIFGELRHLGFTALVDAQMEPAAIKELVQRYRPLINGVEIENEILLFGINDGREKYWISVYDAVKQVDPTIPVHLTVHTNTGSFTKLSQLGGKFDRIGQHAYMDSLKAIPSSRGFSLAAANYGRKVGKPSVITEWNWRGLSRLTPEERAKVYAPIFENVLKTRSVPDIYQFQFNESLAMDPTSLKGIRHYEPIMVSRRPKPEALELARLIRQYSLPSNPVSYLDVDRSVVELDSSGRGTAEFHLTNRSKRTLELRSTIEAPVNVVAKFDDGQKSIRLAPNATAVVKVGLAAQPIKGAQAAGPMPGFYHVFLRLDGDGGLIRYGWAEARLAGDVQLDKAPNAVPTSTVHYSDGAMSFNFNRPLAVVYGDGSPVMDLETATTLQNTLESATGRPVGIYEMHDVPADLKKTGTLILVGTVKTNAMIAAAMKADPNQAKTTQFVRTVGANSEHGACLIIGGATPQDTERATMDLIIRFWKNAKDAAARRIPLTTKEIPLGGDPALLP